MPSTVTLCDISSQHLPSPVSYAVLAPSRKEPLPLCILLLGAGGTRDSMFDLQPLFDEWWAGRTVPPIIIATPTSGLDYYMEDPAGPIRWDSFLAGDFVPHLRSTYNVSDSTVLAGISGGGYGALKLAFAHLHLFAAVAAMQPMLEPALREMSARATVSITPPAVHHSWSVPHAILRSGSQTIPPTGLAGMRSNFAILASPFTSRPVTGTSLMPTMALNFSTACSGISTSRTITILSVVLTTAVPPCAPACARCSPGSAPSGIPRRWMPLPNRAP
jgi:Putative esterase